MDGCQGAIAPRAKSSQAARILLHLQELKHNMAALDFAHGIHGRLVGNSPLLLQQLSAKYECTKFGRPFGEVVLLLHKKVSWYVFKKKTKNPNCYLRLCGALFCLDCQRENHKCHNKGLVKPALNSRTEAGPEAEVD